MGQQLIKPEELPQILFKGKLFTGDNPWKLKVPIQFSQNNQWSCICSNKWGTWEIKDKQYLVLRTENPPGKYIVFEQYEQKFTSEGGNKIRIQGKVVETDTDFAKEWKLVQMPDDCRQVTMFTKHPY